MLHENGINDVQVVAAQGMLTDHYDPTSRTVNLSEPVFASYTVAAAAAPVFNSLRLVSSTIGSSP